MSELDKIIHSPARLKIMAALMALHASAQLDFSSLGEMLGLTDGNLGAHLQTLEEAGYVKIEKTFVARKPRTYVRATTRGRARFEEHLEALRKICNF
ncbi:MAG TPA: transcriptional regulator [Opitutales bacterium]|nr:transcriptional regulator [Opitutales bacterium]